LCDSAFKDEKDLFHRNPPPVATALCWWRHESAACEKIQRTASTLLCLVTGM